MSKLRWFLLVIFWAAVLIPVSVAASGTFYCSTQRSSGGNGTISNPWGCRTDDQLEEIIYDTICDLYGGGTLYRLSSNSYVIYRIDWRLESGQRVCRVLSQSQYSGTTPDTGVTLPMPLILSTGLIAGAVLVGTGLILQRKRVKE